ncbi:Alpha/Beta hydrolase protein [Pilobolus umbonatus]|nr:Alpha/Beta hydrolase protein [Pilobolus umbonatus]
MDDTVFIQSKKDKTTIEARLSYTGGLPDAPAVIIAHPYGPLGGNMDNNVVRALGSYFLAEGYVVILFNFRGSGQSKGKTSWTGMPEREDYLSVIDYLLEDEGFKTNYPKVTRLILGGYSFGGLIAHSISCDKIPCTYLLVSMPLGVAWALTTTKQSFFKRHRDEHSKIICIYGNHDQYTSVKTYEKWTLNRTNIVPIKVEDADHFWIQKERELIDKVDIALNI